MAAFEQGDRRFKEWVQREQEKLTAEVQQARAVALDGKESQQRQGSSLQAQCQKLESRVQDLDVTLSQVSAQAAGLSQMLQAVKTASLSGGTGGSSSDALMAAQPALLQALRMDLDREVSARTSFASDVGSQLKDLHGLLAQVRSKRELDGSREQAPASPVAHPAHEARLAALEGPALGAMRSEVETLREQLRKVGRECVQRCEQAESACAERVSGVQEAATTAARELWEGHQGVVSECKASMASLKDILDAKDRLAEQMETLKQQQRQDDRSELLVKLQQSNDSLLSRIDKVEASTSSEQSARTTSQQQVDGYMRRMGQALETAQAAWIKESGSLAAEVKDIRYQLTREGEAKSLEKQLAQATSSLQHRLDEVEQHASTAASGVAKVEDKVARLSRDQESELQEIEARVKRQVTDVQSIQASKLSQCDFELRGLVRAAAAEHAGHLRAELGRLEESGAAHRSAQHAAMEDAARESEQRTRQLREEFEARVGAAEEKAKRAVVPLEERDARMQADLLSYHRDSLQRIERASAEMRATMDAALAAVQQDMTAQDTKIEQGWNTMRTEGAALEERVTSKLLELDTMAARLFEDARLERERMQQEAERLVGVEREARVGALATHAAAVEARLASMQELLGATLKEAQLKQEDAFATLRQQVEAELLRHRQEAQAQHAELQASTHAAVTDMEERCGSMDRRLSTEMAGFDSRLAVSLAGVNATVRQLSSSLEGRMSSVAERAEEAAADLGAKLEQGLEEAQRSLASAEGRLAAERDALRAELDSLSSDLSRRLRDQAEAAETKAADLDRRVQEQGADLGRRLQEQGEAADAKVQGLDARLQECESKAGVLQMAFTGMKTSLEERATQLEGSMGELEGRVQASLEEAKSELGARCGSLQEALQEQQSASEQRLQQLEEQEKQRLDAAVTDLRSALEEKLSAEEQRAKKAEEDLGDGHQRVEESLKKSLQQAQEDLQEQIDETQSELRKAVDEEQARARQAEAGLEEKHDAEKARAEQAESELKGAVASEEQRAKQAEDGIKVLLSGQAEIIGRQESRASEAMEALQQKLDSAAEEQLQQLQERSQAAASENNQVIESLQQKIDAAEKSLSEASEQRAKDRSDLEEWKVKNSAEVQTTVADQIKHHFSAVDALFARVDDVEKSQEDFKQVIGPIFPRVDALEKSQGDIRQSQTEMAQEAKAAAEAAAEERQAREAERAKMQEEAATKREAESGDLEALKEKLSKLEQEAAGLRETSGTDLEALKQKLEKFAAEEDLTNLKDEVTQQLKDIQKSTSGFEERVKTVEQTAEELEEGLGERAQKGSVDKLQEQLKALEQTAADLEKGLGERAPKESVEQLEARVDGGFDAVLVRLESQRWIGDNVDKVADGVTNQFLRLLDDYVQQLKSRMEKCEKAIAAK